jgi:DNA helicase II / ATP-dependent DNA helicase PcrA
VGDDMYVNDEQKKVIDAKENFLFLLAGAGSGKTRVIVEKIKILVNEGADPKKILAITFTRKSAQEMVERIGNIEVNIHTFHQLCLSQIKKDFNYDFNILEEQKINFTKLQCLKISLYKNSLYRTRKPFFYNAYERALKESNLKDYDDLLIDFFKKNKKNCEIFDHIFIDEFQDTNLLQFDFFTQKSPFLPSVTPIKAFMALEGLTKPLSTVLLRSLEQASIH